MHPMIPIPALPSAMRFFRLARVKLLELSVDALIRVSKEKHSPQRKAEQAAYFFLRRLGSTVVARNWQSGRSPSDIDLIAWEGDTLCFIDVCTRIPRAPAQNPKTRAGDHTGHVLRTLAKDYISKASRGEIPTRFDLLIVDLKQDSQLDAQGPSKIRRSKPEIEYIRGAF